MQHLLDVLDIFYQNIGSMWTKQKWWKERQYNQDTIPLLYTREKQYKWCKASIIMVLMSHRPKWYSRMGEIDVNQCYGSSTSYHMMLLETCAQSIEVLTMQRVHKYYHKSQEYAWS